MNDLRELLQVGYIVKGRRKYAFYVDEDITQNCKKFYNEDLTHTTHEPFDIMEIRRPTSEHGKPVEWITVWEREEPRYTLQCPLTNCYLGVDKIDNKLNWTVKELAFFKCRLTQSEIDDLPHQDFIKSLVRKEVTNVTPKKGEGK